MIKHIFSLVVFAYVIVSLFLIGCNGCGNDVTDEDQPIVTFGNSQCCLQTNRKGYFDLSVVGLEQKYVRLAMPKFAYYVPILVFLGSKIA